MLNVVAIQGRLTHDPELKTTPNGVSVCSFRIACERSYSSKGEERKADFFTITAWRQTAEFVCKYFQKGSMIAIEGSLQTRQYQDQQGSNRTVVEIVANKVSFCGSKSAENPATTSYEKQTANNVREANAAHSAPQQPQSYAQGSVDDFAEISDTDNLPF
nr:MAG TPA: Single strand binding protein [Siphoviridae sp. ctAeS79]